MSSLLRCTVSTNDPNQTLVDKKVTEPLDVFGPSLNTVRSWRDHFHMDT